MSILHCFVFGVFLVIVVNGNLYYGQDSQFYNHNPEYIDCQQVCDAWSYGNQLNYDEIAIIFCKCEDEYKRGNIFDAKQYVWEKITGDNIPNGNCLYNYDPHLNPGYSRTPEIGNGHNYDYGQYTVMKDKTPILWFTADLKNIKELNALEGRNSHDADSSKNNDDDNKVTTLERLLATTTTKTNVEEKIEHTTEIVSLRESNSTDETSGTNLSEKNITARAAKGDKPKVHILSKENNYGMNENMKQNKREINDGVKRINSIGNNKKTGTYDRDELCTLLLAINVSCQDVFEKMCNEKDYLPFCNN